MRSSFPAEWAKQRFVQLTWPHENTDWNYMLDEVTECFVEIAKQISIREKLLIVTKKRERENSRVCQYAKHYFCRNRY